MKLAYRLLAFLIAAVVMIQAAAIAFTMFGVINDSEHGKVIDKNYEPNFGAMLHHIGGMYVIPVAALALLVVAFFAKVQGGVKWALFVLISVVVQVLAAFASFGVPAVGLVHGLNALILFGLAVTAGSRAGRASTAASAEVPAAGTVAV